VSIDASPRFRENYGSPLEITRKKEKKYNLNRGPNVLENFAPRLGLFNNGNNGNSIWSSTFSKTTVIALRRRG